MKKLLPAVAATMFLASFAQNVSAREFADIYTDCGIGAMIAPRNDAVAAVTNVTWDLGTTAISSNATTEDSCKGGQAETAAFIYKTYPQLEQDLARGQGEHLDALLAMTGCDASAKGAVAQGLRGDLAGSSSNSSYSDQSRFEKAEKLHQQLHQRIESDFAGSCTLG
jgi:hypothetical protein